MKITADQLAQLQRDGFLRFEVIDHGLYPEEELVPLEVSKGALIAGWLATTQKPGKQISKIPTRLHLARNQREQPLRPDNWLQRSSDSPLRGFN